MTKLNGWMVGCAVLALCGMAAHGQTFDSLAAFSGQNGANPQCQMTLVQGIDGNFYGTTYQGGSGSGCYAGGNGEGCTPQGGSGCGTVFRVTPRGTLTSLYSFCTQPNCADGATPLAGLVLGTDGSFYGTTYGGGIYSSICGLNGCGTVFKITAAGKLTTVYNFCSQPGCTDGFYPSGTLVGGIDGAFYGTTAYGGQPNCWWVDELGCGTIFKITREGVLTTVHTFVGFPNEGQQPFAGPIQASDGKLYGTTLYGGKYSSLMCTAGCGTIFEMALDGTLTTLYNFCSDQYECFTGADPLTGLIQGTDGNFYGTADGGGGGRGGGTIFRITPGDRFAKLYSFCKKPNCPDGLGPAWLVEATDGNLYGTAYAGGADDSGTIFQLMSGDVLTTLHSFDVAGGAYPSGAMVQSTNGALYGATYLGGGSSNCNEFGIPGCGTIFSLDIGLGPFVKTLPSAGRVGQTGGILGQGFTGTTSVSLNGISASFTVVSDTFIRATVPAGATMGYVTVTTPSGTLTSNVPFHVIP